MGEEQDDLLASLATAYGRAWAPRDEQFDAAAAASSSVAGEDLADAAPGQGAAGTAPRKRTVEPTTAR